MTPRPNLVAMRLSEMDADCDPLEEFIDRQLEVELEVDELTYDASGDESVVVAGIGLSLHLPGTNRCVADMTASFRMRFVGPALRKEAARREFATEHALRIVWLPWTMWLQQTLSLMGLPPVGLPATLPDELIDEGREAFDLCLSMP